MMQHKLDVVIGESFLCSDSTCVLSYNANRDKRFQTFVANRIAAIHEGSRASHWKYVDTGPTRQITRQEGCQLKSCVAANSGFVALTFCGRKNRLWPEQQTVVRDILEDDPEVKKEAKTAFVTTQADGKNDVWRRIISYFSSWFHLKKFIAWILRYRLKLLQSCRRRKEGVVNKASSKSYGSHEMRRKRGATHQWQNESRLAS